MAGKLRNYRPAEYISLPVTFFTQAEVSVMTHEFGVDGYAFCVRVCCYLAMQQGWEVRATPETFKAMSKEFKLSNKKFKTMMDFAVKDLKWLKVLKRGKDFYIRCPYLEEVMLLQLIKVRERKNKWAKKNYKNK